MVARVLADDLLYMPQCADPWHWQAGPDNCPNRNAVYYNQALACTFNPYQSKWFAPRYPVKDKQDAGSKFLSQGDDDCSIVYLVLNCCALHLGIEAAKMPEQNRFLSNPCFELAKVFKFCSDTRPDVFGEETEVQKIFYHARNAREKGHKAKFLAAMMQAYRQLWDESHAN
jgi:hypothetical protein